MPKKSQPIRSNIIKLVIPPLIAIALFVVTIFSLIIPSFEDAMLTDRKDMTRELTNVAWSILSKLHQREQSGEISRAEAQAVARALIDDLRYGSENKDYFWLIDNKVNMIAHPYRPELDGQNVSDFRDPNGKALFVDLVNIVKNQGSGYSEYFWQWKDDPEHIVPKLSYVKGFEPWGWIVGTGIYIHDVKEQITHLTDRLMLVTLIITFVISGLLLFLTIQSIRIERARQSARTALIDSKDRYQALVEASTDGFIMILDEQRMISNTTICQMLGYSEDEFSALSISDIIKAPDGQDNYNEFINTLFIQENSSKQFETQLIKNDGTTLKVLLTTSSISFAGKPAHIIIARDLSEAKRTERLRTTQEQEAIIVELQTTLQHLNRNISDSLHPVTSCDINTTIREAAIRMTEADTSTLFITSTENIFAGIITDNDIRKRLVATGMNSDQTVAEIMTAPILKITDHALLFEAAMMMQDHKVQSLAVENNNGKIYGVIDSIDLLEVHGYSAVSIIEAINKARTIEEIIIRHEKMPFFIKALMDAGSHPSNVNRLISRICEVVTLKLIDFALKETGTPPARFAFLGLGSVGREEQTLSTDQDNAIIFEDQDSEEANATVQKWFLDFSRKLCGWLDKVGYTYCDGDIMAQNPKWCQPVSQWQEYFSQWIFRPEPQQMLEINIFFDFRCIYGENILVEAIRRQVEHSLKENPTFILQLSEDIQRQKPPIGMFGNILTQSPGEHEDIVSIKDAMLPIVNIARAYALKHHIWDTSTLDRLQRLRERNIIKESRYQEIYHAYNYLMQMRLKHQSIQAQNGESIDNYIIPRSLTRIDEITLKTVLGQINEFLGKLRFDLTGIRDM